MLRVSFGDAMSRIILIDLADNTVIEFEGRRDFRRYSADYISGDVRVTGIRTSDINDYSYVVNNLQQRGILSGV